MLTKIEQIKRGAHEKNSNCAFLQRFFGLFKVQLFFDVESNIFKEKDRYLGALFTQSHVRRVYTK